MKISFRHRFYPHHTHRICIFKSHVQNIFGLVIFQLIKNITISIIFLITVQNQTISRARNHISNLIFRIFSINHIRRFIQNIAIFLFCKMIPHSFHLADRPQNHRKIIIRNFRLSRTFQKFRFRNQIQKFRSKRHLVFHFFNKICFYCRRILAFRKEGQLVFVHGVN